MSSTPREMSPGAKLDFSFGWADPAPKGPWLASGETIASRTITVSAPLDLVSQTEAAGTVTVWVEMPADTSVGTMATITCAIETSLGRKDSRRREVVCALR